MEVGIKGVRIVDQEPREEEEYSSKNRNGRNSRKNGQVSSR